MSSFVVEFGANGTPPAAADGRLDAPAFHRNAEPIWLAIGDDLTSRGGDLLELGSGTGMHCVAYARRTPALTWWPSDLNPKHLTSIAAWRAHEGLANVRAPQRIDLADRDWAWRHDGRADAKLAAILCINVLHISPWPVSQHLLDGAARQLKSGGRLFVYGPFMRDGAHTAPSNAAFDAKLRAENAAWGVRDISDLNALARAAGLSPAEEAPMPANNFVLAFTKLP